MSEERAEKLAEEHAEWFASILYEIVKRVYRDAFLHGWKHAEEERSGRENDEVE